MFCFLLTIFSLSKTSAQTERNIEQIPDMELKLNNNKSVNLKDLKGKVVLLDFWYRGCFPCAKSIPGLIELQQEFKDSLVIIGINKNDMQEDVTDYLNYKDANYFSTYKTDINIPKIFNVQVYPTVILYDKDGNLIKVKSGHTEGGTDSLRKAIKKALK